MYQPCRSLEDVEYQTANGEGNPLWQIEVLCGEIRSLQRDVARLKKGQHAHAGSGDFKPSVDALASTFFETPNDKAQGRGAASCADTPGAAGSTPDNEERDG